MRKIWANRVQSTGYHQYVKPKGGEENVELFSLLENVKDMK